MHIRLLVKRIVLFLTALLVAGALPGAAGCGVPTEHEPGGFPGGVGGSSSTTMPPALRASYLATRQQDGGEAYRFQQGSSGSAAARNGAHHVDVTLANGALRVVEAQESAWQLGLRWTGLGRGSQAAPVASPTGEVRVAENRASYLRDDGSEEWYVNGPLGVEQGFVLAAPPEGARDQALAVEVAVEGGLAPVLSDGGTRIALRDARGATVARYAELAAFDAGGVSLRAWLEAAGAVLRLRVDDAGARYPLRIDPLVWTEQAEIPAGDGAAGDMFGTSVSVSAGIAVIGAADRNVGTKTAAGAAYVFVQNGATWTQQGPDLIAGDGAPGDHFGQSVSVSGGTAIVGAYNHNAGGINNAGEAYVFVQSGATWNPQATLTAKDGANGDQFGISVSVSGDIAIVGAHQHSVDGKADAGAAYVFVRSGTTWTRQGPDLTATDGAANDDFGTSVSVSGTTAVVGASGHKASAGAAYVFMQNGATWTQQGPDLTAIDGAAGDLFGSSVSVSGSTAIVGAYKHNGGAGAAYVFVQNGTTWTQQGPDLTASDGMANDNFGNSVSVSGGSAVVGARNHQVGTNAGAGAGYVFTQNGTAWTQQGELTASDGAASDLFGSSVSVSGSTAIVGARMHQVGTNASAGAAYVFQGCDVTGCSAGTWCDETMNACTPLLANGARIPTEPTSRTLNGMCTVAAAVAVCQSGVCDTTNNTCGYANGDGPCTPTNGATVCLSGSVCTGGVCAPPGPCTADANCPVGQWCNESNSSCASQLTNGAPIPNDPPHTNPTLNYTCTPAAAMLVCQSGLCNPVSNLCGFADGPTCIPEDCQSNFCSDGVCCDTPCTGTCMACNVAGSVGTCTALPAGGTDPNGAAPCYTPNACDGAGNCVQLACMSSNQCPFGTTCNGSVCVPDPSQPGACRFGFDTDCADAGAGKYCSREGICCDRPCTDKCEQCLYPTTGVCSVQPGVDLHGECDRTGDLDGGDGGGTELPSCGSSVCTQGPNGPDAPGMCAAATIQTICMLGTCSEDGLEGTQPTSCTASDGSLTCPSPGVTFSCPIYRCAPELGTCKTSCDTVNDCVPGYVCDLSGQCQPPSVAFPAAPASCSLPPHPGGDDCPWERAALLLLPALAATRWRRRPHLRAP